MNNSERFNHPINNLPNSLTKLTIGNNFNFPINNLPKNITYLILNNEINYPIDNLPDGLEILKFGKKLEHMVENLPLSITDLTLDNILFDIGFNWYSLKESHKMFFTDDELEALDNVSVLELSVSFVKDPVPEIIPDNVNWVPPTSTVELAPKDIAPANVEVPVDVLIVPPSTVNPSVVE